jgi:hypothetical protein
LTNTSTERLHDAMRDLHKALGTMQDLDESDRDELTAAIAEIRATLDSTEQDLADSDGTIRGRLVAAVERFEDRHPKLTQLVGRLADSLSELGV